MPILCLLFFLIFTPPAGAAIEGIYLGGGYLNQNSFSTTTKNSGEISYLGASNYFPLSARYYLPLQGEYWWAPQILFTHISSLLYATETPDKGAKKDVLLLGAPVVYNFSPELDGSAGLGIQYYSIEGKGGSKTMANGTSTASYKLPGRTQSSTNYFLQFGVGFDWGPARIDSDLLIINLLSADRRAYNILLTGHFRL